MNLINYLSGLAIPFTILMIIFYGMIEKKNTFDFFICGAKEGIEIVIKIFPTILALFIAIGLLRSSGILDLLISWIYPVTTILKIPSEIMPLAILRPISGSASMAVATDIMKSYGVNSDIGLMASVAMGATETTLYTIAVYTSSIGIKKTRFVLIPALLGDLVRNYCFNSSVFFFYVTQYHILSLQFKQQFTKCFKYIFNHRLFMLTGITTPLNC